jgi:hypothetical protein
MLTDCVCVCVCVCVHACVRACACVFAHASVSQEGLILSVGMSRLIDLAKADLFLTHKTI